MAMNPRSGWVLWGLMGLAVGAIGATGRADVVLLGVQYRPDRAFPEHECFWHESQFPGPCSASSLGASVHVYLRNTGASAVTVRDVLLAGESLKYALKEEEQVTKRHPCSIWFASLTPQQLQTLLDAGEPVWYKADPAPIPPGGTAQVVVRLRQIPVVPSVDVGVVHSAGTVSTAVPVAADAPVVAGAGFAPDLAKAYLYWRRPGGAVPVRVLVDGSDVTAGTSTVADPAVGMAVSVVRLAQPPAPGSFHVFQGVYADGRTATAGLRAWVNEFLYGTWGAQPGEDDDFDAARAWIDDAVNHCVNALVVQLGSAALGDFFKTVSGRQYAADRGYGCVIDEVGKWACSHPWMWFIRDEPDCADSRVVNLPESKKVGSLGMMCIEQGEALRAADPTAPTTLNIDGTYKPYNWYNYGQLPDVLMTDPYYQVRLREAYWTYPQRIPLYSKATYIYAVSQLANASCEPNPLHVVLYSCEYKDSSGAVFPFPAPACKRIEVYYALAAGAKGLSYWWYLPGRPSNGLGAGSAAALALWREIGLLGAEIRTAAPLLVRSCPVPLAVQASAGLWVRSLLSGTDTILLLVVNDQYVNDEQGCHYTPVSGATLTMPLPAWMSSPATFEIAAGGIGDVGAEVVGNELRLSLGAVNLTRMIVVTADPSLRGAIEQRYYGDVRARVCAIAPDVCSPGGPPSITQQPQSRSVCAGASVVIGVAATGAPPLTYRWQKNGTDLEESGRYAGVTTDTLSIPSVEPADAGNYRCVVSNPFGTVNSIEATLTVLSCNPACLQNLGFEGGFTAGAGNGWIKFVKSGSEGPNLVFSDETTERHSGAHCQEIYSHDVGYDGGVYQRFQAAPGQNYTVKAWFKCYSPQGSGIAEGFLGLDPTGGTDPNSPNVIWSSKPYEYWSQKVWSVTAQGDFITVYLRGRSTKAATLNKTGYVWIDDVEVAPGAPADLAPQPLSTTSIRWRWADMPSETGYRVRDVGGADVSGLLPADTTQWVETNGILPNTSYTRRITAVNDCGESDPSSGQTTYSLIEPPEDVAVGPVTTNSIVVTPVGVFSNLAVASSGVLTVNTTAGSDSGWSKSVTPWTCTGLTPNTPYEFVARARNGNGLETPDCLPVTAWTLSVPPEAGSIVPDNPSPRVGQPVRWTAVDGFGAGRVSHYRFAWNRDAVHAWSGEEPRWSGGTLTTVPTSPGTWYLHVMGCNGEDVPNGTCAWAVTATIGADFDSDGDVDLEDFGRFQTCFNGPGRPPASPDCGSADLDGDGDVDLSDFASFQACFNGPAQIPACG